MKARFLLLFAVMLIPMVLGAQNDYWYKKGLDAKDPKDKIEYYTKSIEKAGASYCSYLKRGCAKYDFKDYQGALSDYGKAIEIDPKYTDAYYNRGITKNELKDYKGAIADFHKVIEINPKDIAGYGELGIVHSEMKEYDAAIEITLKGLKQDPKNATLFDNLGYFYMAKWDITDAISNFKKCIEIDNKNFDAILGLSTAFYYKNDKVNSKKYLEQAKSVEPRLKKGMDGITELYESGYSYSDKHKATLKKMFEEFK